MTKCLKDAKKMLHQRSLEQENASGDLRTSLPKLPQSHVDPPKYYTQRNHLWEEQDRRRIMKDWPFLPKDTGQ